MNNILLITDVARLGNVFGRLTDDSTVRLRIANNLEKGGEEIAIDKPDVVFVQTHLSGLSAEILIMHLKKQLGRKRSRFVLLAAPGQVNDAILAPYQGWLNTSLEDDRLLDDLRFLLNTFTSKGKKSAEVIKQENIAVDVDRSASSPLPEEVTTPVLVEPVEVTLPELILATKDSEPVTAPAPTDENVPDDQGISYPPRPRLTTVYSEFNSSFDAAVSSTPEPESLGQSASARDNNWLGGGLAPEQVAPKRSKGLTFLLWLAPVALAVIVMTMLQHRESQQSSPTPTVSAKSAVTPEKAPATTLTNLSSVVSRKPVLKPVSTNLKAPSKIAGDSGAQNNDKAVIVAITGNREAKKNSVTSHAVSRPTRLPDFIPRGGLDKSYSDTNPGWERYTSSEVEYRVYREKEQIKAIQVIALGGISISNVFLNSVFRQLGKNTLFTLDSLESKEGYRIERGHIADNLKVVYYRDEKGKRLRAFVLTWN
ncbi:MAG: hypothetical protein A2X82_00590 [Geobacteraceae bacterium GWC2_55_20]|nr:MAG: hypothetical protein A2X82_00590 [Geobacteraceae bacterium GWC2_55_20]OGU22516.1 MAG: hypothetical protein A2X85_15920 [Geobacteraceae bacterium GWF2_54_21]HBA72490.1 hypothetical protein [Geobacter sp.]